MPKPRSDETESEFVQRCVPIVIEDGTAEDGLMAAAICHRIWETSRKNSMSSSHDILLSEIKGRTKTETEFNGGILVADRYVRTLQDVVGLDSCYQYASRGNVSFQDAMKRAGSVLTYNNPDMVLQDVYEKDSALIFNGKEITLPKNTLMVFKHVLTTPRKDRDGDILRTKGAILDPRMLLLYQHVHTLPIGKMLAVVEHSSKRITLVSAIVDLNELAHDSAVMVDNDMGRFSHGFKALEFEKLKGTSGEDAGGFDVKRYEVMEESLVSVPSNVDAESEEVLLSLIEGGKLTSGLMKDVGASIRQHMPKSVPVTLDLKVMVNGKAVGDENKSGDGSSETKGVGESGGDEEPASKETDGDGDKEGDPKDEEVKECPKCGTELDANGVCSKCGRGEKDDDDDSKGFETKENEKDNSHVDDDFDDEGGEGNKGFESEKAGRVLSSSNYKTIAEVHDDLSEVYDHCSTRSGKALTKKCQDQLKQVLASATREGAGGETNTEPTVQEAIAIIYAKATADDRAAIMTALDAIETAGKREKRTSAFQRMRSF